jgi:DNA-binding NarL/FixJ family response regulator
MSTITVVVAGPDRNGRKTCVDLLRGEPRVRVLGEARGGLETLAAVTMLKPRILLMDLALSPARGRPLIPAIRHEHPGTRVILLTGHRAQHRVLDALSLGAHGCLEWSAVSDQLAAAVKAVDAGEAWVPRRMVAHLMDRLAALFSEPAARIAAPQGSA